MILNVNICVPWVLCLSEQDAYSLISSGFYPKGYFGDRQNITKCSVCALTKYFAVNMELTSRHLVHLFKCWFVADAPTGNADSSSSFFIKIQWNKHSPHTSSFLSCNLLTQGALISSLMTAEATQQQDHSDPWCFWMALETRAYLWPHPAKRCCHYLCRHRNLLLNLGHDWDCWYGHRALLQRSVLKWWAGPGKAEVLVPGPAAVLCCGSSKLDHPVVSAFPPLLCPVFSFCADIILPCMSR